MKQLPALRFDTSIRETPQVAWDGYIRVRGNPYSVPANRCGQTVVILITLNGVLKVLSADHQLLAEH